MEQCCIYSIVDDESWRHGAAEYRRRTRDDGRVQGGGAVWRHGGVDGWPGEGLHFDIHSEDGLAEDGGGNFQSVRTRRYLWSLARGPAMAVAGAQGPVFLYRLC